MANRRLFLKGLASILPAGLLLKLQNSFGSTQDTVSSGRDYYKEIGIKPFINAAAAYSILGGRNMWPEVVEAMEYAGKRNVIMEELHDKVGKRIALLIGCEAALVSAGACSAMTLGTAACLTGKNEDFIRRIPDLRGMKKEVIIQKAHRFVYDHAVRNCGVRLIEIETVEDVKKAVNQETAMLFYNYSNNEQGKIKPKEFADLGKKYNIPTLIDGSNILPPVEILSKFLNLGFDLAAFSGGKGLRGPYSTGLLLGRKDLIEAARLNNSPNSDTIGRGMKVSKEEILGAMVAVEFSLKFDYSVEYVREGRLVNIIADKVSSIGGIRTEVIAAQSESGRPHLRLYWDKSVIKISVEEAKKQLAEGDPPIEVCALELADGEFEIGTAMLKEEEIDTLVKCLKRVFMNAA